MKTYTIANTGHVFHMPESTPFEGAAQFDVFKAALNAVNALAEQKQALLNDSDLSGPGKEKRLKPAYETGWAILVAGYNRLAELDAATNQREAVLLAVPQLHPTHSACAVEDVELRQYFRALPLSERTKIMTVIQDTPEGGERYLRLQIAILRSPIPLPADHEMAFFKSLWKQTKRLGNVAESIAIDSERAATEFATRGLNFLQGILASSALTGWSRMELLAWLVRDAGRIDAAKALGFGVFDIENAKQAQKVAGRIPATA
ncbi:hypothetical protein [Hydrogenophaga sp. PAMC20947]|uniref:hypothetical protein n=1 Tax=Hydrogenophaga sp. PAMC20947 TaxID=2565558 RepID=UPI00109DD9E0|nr:hypothetical protein [Hydrogenophaga sp. PAMC20947]QCB46625.1 hypothetical protein E5678_11675 [Hydrogenophaga sp. PAMC20947]